MTENILHQLVDGQHPVLIPLFTGLIYVTFIVTNWYPVCQKTIHSILNYQRLKLVGGIPTPLKNMKVSGGYYSQYNGKTKAMFQTTNQ